MRSALAAVDRWVSGIRRRDSQTRAGAPKFGWDKRFGLWKLNPLADWTEKQVWTYIHEHDIPYNPLHDQGYPSIGCTHCTRKPGGRRGRARRALGRARQDRVRAARVDRGARKRDPFDRLCTTKSTISTLSPPSMPT